MPIVVMLALMIVQVALVARQEVVVVHAAREGARAAAVGEPADASVQIANDGDYVTVIVRVPAHTDAPLVGRLVGEHELSAELTMWRERPP
jgi:hypothetical protein